MSQAGLTFVPPRPDIPAVPMGIGAFLRALRTNALGMWPEEAYETGVLAQSFLRRRRLLLNDPEAISHVLIGNADNYRRSPATVRILRPIVGGGLLLSTGEAWRHQRRTIAPALAPRVMPLLARHIAAAAQDAVRALAARAGEPVDMLGAMQELALAIAGRSMFSLESGAFGAEMRALLDEFGVELARPHLFDMLLPSAVPTLRDLRRRRFQRRWMGLIERIIAARPTAADAAAPRDLFDMLAAARDPETGAAFPADHLRDQVATMITAGHETTAVALFWALYLVASAPGVQERIAAEAAPLDLTPDGAGAALARLTTTRAVVNETLRLYPPAFVIVREAVGADRVGSLDIPAGTLMMVAPWVLHRHRRLWRDPDTFDPSRFLPDAAPPPRFSFLPFGAGPRVCVGAQFALAEATLALATLVRHFRVSVDDAVPVLPAAVVTTQPDRRPPFRLEPRG